METRFTTTSAKRREPHPDTNTSDRCEEELYNTGFFSEYFSELQGNVYLLTDLGKMKYHYVSPSIEQITGYPCEVFRKKGPGFMQSLYHPEDLDFFEFVCNEISVFSHMLPANERFNYRYSYTINVKRPNGLYVCLLVQVAHLRTDVNNNSFCFAEFLSDATHFNDPSVQVLRIFKYKEDGDITEIVHNFHKHNSVAILTKKEMEVQKLVKDGFSSKEIADKLHVSLNTIATHRRNIRKKTG